MVVLFVGVGIWIFYNTNIVNAYQPPGKQEPAAEPERRFKQYENLPMPVVTGTKVDVELYPEKGYFIANGEYSLRNNTDLPITEIHQDNFKQVRLSNKY